MINRQTIGRDVLILLIGAAIGALFGILVAYPQILASTRENAARIELNEKRIEMLMEAHEIRHITPTAQGDARNE